MPLPGRISSPPAGQASPPEASVMGGLKIPFESRTAMREFGNGFRDRQRRSVPKQPFPIKKMSEMERVYIYNASPWSYQVPMGSFGTFTIPAITEAQAIAGGLDVAGPLVIDGLPVEYYPMGEGKVDTQYHQPREGFGREESRPGYDFAMEILGEGRNVSKGQSLIKRGLFVSNFAQPEPANKDWIAEVAAAKEALRIYCVHECQEANVEYNRRNFHTVRNDQLYQKGRIIHGTVNEYPWLGDTAETTKSKLCWSCHTPLHPEALRCNGPSCGELQVSKEEYEKARELKLGRI